MLDAENEDMKEFIKQEAEVNKLTSFATSQNPNVVMALFKNALTDLHPIETSYDDKKYQLRFKISGQNTDEVVGDVLIYETEKKGISLVEVKKVAGSKFDFNDAYLKLMEEKYCIDQLADCPES